MFVHSKYALFFCRRFVSFHKINIQTNNQIWNADTFYFTDAEIGEELVGDISMASPGVGAAANSYMSMINVDDDPIKISRAGLPPDSPGQGAFTIYHGRSFYATAPIEPGQEIFVSYGQNYFTSRKRVYGYLPMPGRDYERADHILNMGLDIIRHNKNITAEGNIIDSTSKSNSDERNGECSAAEDNNDCDVSSADELLREEIWNDAHALIKDISENIFKTSRILNAIPANISVIEDVLEDGGTAYQDYNQSVKDLEWLEEHGQCMDNIKVGRSTIPNAGRGAFSTRFIPSGGLVSPAPLVHIEEIDNMVMFMEHVYNEDDHLVPNRRGEYTWQLILNYCFAHHQSTLLLCPYGLLSSLINHSKENSNTKIQWSDDHRMRHPEWFEEPIAEWGYVYHTGLQIDFVATRNIEADEEILIDYGSLWQKAWDSHVKEFKFEEYRSEHYRPAYELNELVFDDDFELRTEKDREYELDGVRVFCRRWYLHQSNSRIVRDQACNVVRKLGDDSYLVRAVKWKDDNEDRTTSLKQDTVLFWGVPKDVFYFEDLPYTRDIHQQWAFRHPIMIPEDMFPNVSLFLFILQCISFCVSSWHSSLSYHYSSVYLCSKLWKNVDDEDNVKSFPHFAHKFRDEDDDDDDGHYEEENHEDHDDANEDGDEDEEEEDHDDDGFDFDHAEEEEDHGDDDFDFDHDEEEEDHDGDD